MLVPISLSLNCSMTPTSSSSSSRTAVIWVHSLRITISNLSSGINVPVLPGLMPLRSYDGLVRMCELCGSTVPKKILDDLKGFKDDDKQVQDYGVLQMVEMCKVLIENGVCGLHFYTLNQERSVTRILLGLGLLNPDALVKPLPWTGVRCLGSFLRFALFGVFF